MGRARQAAALTLCAWTIGAGVQVRALQQSPLVFRSAVELVTIDLQVTSPTRQSIRELAPADFEIRIDGAARPASSATRLHSDDGTVVRDRDARAGRDKPECVFGFHRTTNRPTVHYLIAVERIEADLKAVRDVKVKLIDIHKDLSVQQYLWRSPIRRGGRP